MATIFQIQSFGRRSAMVILLLFAGLSFGCGDGWRMDYGDPSAQFLGANVAARGSAFVGEKITVKGTVTRVDQRDPKATTLYLKEGITCDFTRMTAMVSSCKPGDTVYVDGILRRCAKGDILLQTAVLRDPTAAFEPQ